MAAASTTYGYWPVQARGGRALPEASGRAAAIYSATHRTSGRSLWTERASLHEYPQCAPASWGWHGWFRAALRTLDERSCRSGPSERPEARAAASANGAASEGFDCRRQGWYSVFDADREMVALVTRTAALIHANASAYSTGDTCLCSMDKTSCLFTRLAP